MCHNSYIQALVMVSTFTLQLCILSVFCAFWFWIIPLFRLYLLSWMATSMHWHFLDATVRSVAPRKCYQCKLSETGESFCASLRALGRILPGDRIAVFAFVSLCLLGYGAPRGFQGVQFLLAGAACWLQQEPQWQDRYKNSIQRRRGSFNVALINC